MKYAPFVFYILKINAILFLSVIMPEMFGFRAQTFPVAFELE